MYLNVKPFERPKNTTTLKRKENTYVYVTSKKNYNKEKKYYEYNRVCIGKMNDEDLFIPNHRYLDFFDNFENHDSFDEFKKSKALKTGSTNALRCIFEELELNKMLKNNFLDEKDYKIADVDNFIFDLASYMTITECADFQYYKDYAWDHLTFSSKGVSDSTISRFLKEISKKDNIANFLLDWSKKNFDDSGVFLSIDGSNVNSVSEGIDLVEPGKAKDDPTKPQINFSYLYNQTNGRPISYELFKGSTVDMASLKTIIKKFKANKINHINILLDRGYFSESNIDAIMKEFTGFLIMAKTTNFVVKEAINECKEFNIMKTKNMILGHDVFGMTLEKKLFKRDPEALKRYFHIYFNSSKRNQEELEFRKQIKSLYDEISEFVGKSISDEFISHCSDYLKLMVVDNKLEKVEIDEEKCNEYVDNLGYFCIISSMKLSAEKALNIYRNRDQIEKMFMILKSHLGMNSFGVQSDEALRGKFFISFIASILRNEIYLRTYELRNYDSKNYTVPAILKELDHIEILSIENETYYYDEAFTKRQKSIMKALNGNFYSISRLNSIIKAD